MIYLCNYAQNTYVQSRALNGQSARQFGVERVLEWSQEKIHPDFIKNNQQIFDHKQGAGLWLWKPYIIYETLSKLTTEDYLIYSDAGVKFIKPIFPLLKICEEKTSGLMPFHLEVEDRRNRKNIEVFQSKRDIFISMDCDNEEVKTGRPRSAAFSIWIKNRKTLAFLAEWLYHSQNIKCIGNEPSSLGEEDPRFVTTRHDQSIYSTLINKYKLPSFRDCSQWGNPFMDVENVEYGQIIDHHRIRV